jgi:tetratricopeptide (TPR) repeat protein
VAEEHPLILVIDDLHQTDDASLAVLHLVLRKAGGFAIQAVFIARSSELLESPNASRLYEHSEALGIRPLEIAPLSEEEAIELLDSLLAEDDVQPRPSIRRSLLRASAGFPMLLELLVRDWQTCGDQCLALAVGSMTTEPGRGGAAVAAYRAIVDRLARSLDSSTRNVLNVAALLGSRMNDLELYSLIDMTVGQTMSGMGRLAELRLLRDGEHGLEFINEVVRAHVYLSIPSPLRRTLHGSVATRLINATGGVACGLETAWHCIRAGRIAEAKPYLLKGAEESLDRGAVHEAERGLSEALPLLDGPTLERAVLLLSEVLQDQGRWQESLHVLDEHTARDRSPVVQGDECGDRAFVLSTLNRLRLEVIAPADAPTLAECLLTIVTKSQDTHTRSLCARALALCAAKLPASANWGEIAETLRGLCTRTWPKHDKTRLLISLVTIAFRAQQREDSGRWASEAKDLISQRYEPSSLSAEAFVTLGCLSSAEGEYNRAHEEFSRSFTLYKRLGNHPQMRATAANLALCCGRLGRYEEQVQWGTQALAGSEPAPCYNQVLGLYSLTSGLAHTGRVSQAAQTAAQLDSIYLNSAPAFVDQARHLYTAEVYELLGKNMEAISAAKRGTTGVHAELHVRSFAGLYAKWLSKTTNASNLDEHRRRIGELLAIVDSCDMFDRDLVKRAASTVLSEVINTTKLGGSSRGQQMANSPAASASAQTRLHHQSVQDRLSGA